MRPVRFGGVAQFASASGSPAASSTATAAAAGLRHRLKVCAPGSATGGSGRGINGKTIRIGVMGDPGNTFDPGLGQEFFDVADAFAKWCNAAGGINGRTIVVDKLDAKLFNVAAKVIDACQSDFMLVGGGNGADLAGVKPRLACKLGQIPAYTVLASATAAGLQVTPVALTRRNIRSGRSDGPPEALLGIETGGIAPAILPPPSAGWDVVAHRARLPNRSRPQRDQALARLLAGQNPLPPIAFAAYIAMHDAVVPFLHAAPARPEPAPTPLPAGDRRELPDRRTGYTQKAAVGGRSSIFFGPGEYADGSLGELSLSLHKESPAFRGLMDSFCVAVSLGLQHGVPLAEFVDAFTLHPIWRRRRSGRRSRRRPGLFGSRLRVPPSGGELSGPSGPSGTGSRDDAGRCTPSAAWLSRHGLAGRTAAAASAGGQIDGANRRNKIKSRRVRRTPADLGCSRYEGTSGLASAPSRAG